MLFFVLNICSQLTADFDVYLHQCISVQRRQCSYERSASLISRSLHHILTTELHFALRGINLRFCAERSKKDFELKNAVITFGVTLRAVVPKIFYMAAQF